MNKRSSGILVLVLLAITAILHSLVWYEIADIPYGVLSVSRWAFVFALCLYAWFRKTLTAWILVSMVAGVLIGYEFPPFSQTLVFLRQIFLNLVKVIVAPLLFSTLVVGIAGHSNLKQVGRLGWKSILYFEIVTTLALVIGLIAINVSKAGMGIEAPPELRGLPPSTEKVLQQKVINIMDRAGVSV